MSARRSYTSAKAFKASVRKREEKPLPYWAHYLLRTFVVLFLLLVYYLFGLCNPKEQQQVKEFIKTEFNSNASLPEAYDTYKGVDYKGVLTHLRTYVKAQMN